MKQSKFEVFFENGESLEINATSESEAIDMAEAARPKEDVAFAQLVETELQAVA